MLSCPSQRATLRISPVACSVFKAQVCRRTCGDSRLVFKGGHLLTAAGMCLLRICLKPERVRGWARALRNSSGTLASPRMRSEERRVGKGRRARGGRGECKEDVTREADSADRAITGGE